MEFLLSNKKGYALFFGIVALFLFLRLPAIHAPYHQDEYKWPIIVNPELTEPGVIPHPPLSEVIYRTTFKIFGEENFRVTPLLFSILNLGLIFIIVRQRYGDKAALWTSFFFAVSFYSILASVMIDTDGAVLPFFLLLSILFYDQFNSEAANKKILFGTLLVVSLILGMLVKFSFVLVIGALLIDFVWNQKDKLTKKNILYILGGLVVFAVLVAVLLFVAQKVFDGFNLSKIISYAETFIKGFGGRNFFQSGIQFIKALFYLSPFLVFSGLLSICRYRKDLKLFHAFILLGLVFYLVLFDFSGGALDRYFQFLIVPLCVIGGVITAEYINSEVRVKNYLWAVLATILIFLAQLISQWVPPLHPKSEWIGRIASLKWNFLYPFSGGSGPLGFYVSFSFIMLAWILSILLVGLYLWRKNSRKEIWIVLLLLGLVYNAVFAEEYLFGKINGHAPTLVRDVARFIKDNPNISKVVVYNDNGGREIMQTGKYEKRLYTSPQFDLTQKIETINNFSGHYLEIDVPPIDPNSVYRKYLDSCKKIYEENSIYMTATVYDCRTAPDISI